MWNTFFGEAWSRIQAAGYAAERTASECALIDASLRLQPGADVLDIPCGIGRHSIELARRGFRVTGVDFSSTFIAEAEASARNAAVSVRFVVCDMIEGIWTIIDNGDALSVDSSIRIYTFRELRHLLESAGFVNLQIRDGKTGDAFRLGSPRAIVVAEKPSG